MDRRSRQARRIYSAINEILHTYWDPIGMGEAPPKDEYESYVGVVYRALADGKSEAELVSLLATLENDAVGLSTPWQQKRDAARRLAALDIRLNDPQQPGT
jgi:hypothetical protein